MKIRGWLPSIAVFVVFVGVLAAFDERVQESLTLLFAGGNPLHRRAAGVGEALFSMLQYQFMDNGPMMVFVVLGAVLFAFMVKS
jgi:hypothetical protein